MTLYLAEKWLYADLDPTALIEISTTSASGPWTEIRLTTTAPLRTALEEWETLATAALAPTFAFSFDTSTNEVVLDADAAWYLRLSETMAELLGFSSLVYSVTGSPYELRSDTTPMGIATLPDGLEILPPVTEEGSELAEYRAGRAAAYHYQRSLVVEAEAILGSDRTAVLDGPLLVHGRARLVCGDDAAAYSSSNLDGYLDVDLLPTEDALEIRPLDELDEDIAVRFRGSMGDL